MESKLITSQTESFGAEGKSFLSKKIFDISMAHTARQHIGLFRVGIDGDYIGLLIVSFRYCASTTVNLSVTSTYLWGLVGYRRKLILWVSTIIFLAARSIIKKHKIQCELLTDRDNNVTNRYGIKYWPTTLELDRQCRIVKLLTIGGHSVIKK